MDNRKARLSDLDSIMEIIEDAKAFLKSSGVDQWQNGYPDYENFRRDVESGNCHICVEDGRVLGVVVLYVRERSDEEPGYGDVSGEGWIKEGERYGVFHRLAVDKNTRSKGVAAALLQYCEELVIKEGCGTMRGDTHRHNLPMRSLLEKSGYSLRGSIMLEKSAGKDRRREGYEKVLECR